MRTDGNPNECENFAKTLAESYVFSISGGIDEVKAATKMRALLWNTSQQKGNCNGNFCYRQVQLNASDGSPSSARTRQFRPLQNSSYPYYKYRSSSVGANPLNSVYYAVQRVLKIDAKHIRYKHKTSRTLKLLT